MSSTSAEYDHHNSASFKVEYHAYMRQPECGLGTRVNLVNHSTYAKCFGGWQFGGNITSNLSSGREKIARTQPTLVSMDMKNNSVGLAAHGLTHNEVLNRINFEAFAQATPTGDDSDNGNDGDGGDDGGNDGGDDGASDGYGSGHDLSNTA
ncbi:hypothetical protein C8R41DRAFT_914568 [Lentinula lateritia]|uniref:Uncharacterized protein n=1 Tax=Lentinula lateritia TaxID=40482 RepID=A0ABQ8VX66_9AGAR|nr:hypothetical protein C8R41DRAFT_914568 [Lentinula lateritia]